MSKPAENEKTGKLLPDIPLEYQNGVHIQLDDGEEKILDCPTEVSRERIEELKAIPIPDPNCPSIHVVLEDGDEQSFVES